MIRYPDGSVVLSPMERTYHRHFNALLDRGFNCYEAADQCDRFIAPFRLKPEAREWITSIKA